MSIRRMFRVVSLSAAGLLAALGTSPARAQGFCPGAVGIDWDRYGVPHVSAPDDGALFYAFGWAQMHSHANLVLDLYGSARGRAAEYWGATRLQSDALVHTLEIPAVAAEAYAAQGPEFRRYVDLFVKGMNDYAAAHPEAVRAENRAVLPVQPTDPFAHLVRTMEMGFVGREILQGGNVAVPGSSPPGSNGLVFSPAQTASGNALLLSNPHLPWSGFYTFYEAHLALGERDFYGATLVGLPVLVLGFNNTLGWTHTANYVDGSDLFRVDVVDAGHYRFDGQPRAYEVRRQTVQVRGAGGELQPRELTMRSTVHGPVFLERDGKAYAYRSTRRLYPRLFEQYWRMVRATSLAEFVEALRMMQLPYFNVLYADQRGEVMYMWNGLLPERSTGDAASWQQVVAGDRSETLWTRAYGFDQMPRATNPPTGWLQNTNDPPWTSTLPAVLEPGRHPRFIVPSEELGLRTQQLLRTLQTGVRPSFESLREIKFGNRVEMADRILDDLFAAIAVSPHTGEDRALLDEAGRVLRAWDRRVAAESRGAVFFREWLRKLGHDIFAHPYNPAAPLTTPRGLANPPQAVDKLLEAARHMRTTYGALDVKWGDVYRLQWGSVDVPASGGQDFMGIFHALSFNPDGNGRFLSRGGESYSAIVEFSNPVRAQVLLSYGNSSQEGSPHVGDQLPLVAAGTMRPALLSDADIQGALASRDRLSPANGDCNEH